MEMRISDTMIEREYRGSLIRASGIQPDGRRLWRYRLPHERCFSYFNDSEYSGDDEIITAISTRIDSRI